MPWPALGRGHQHRGHRPQRRSHDEGHRIDPDGWHVFRSGSPAVPASASTATILRVLRHLSKHTSRPRSAAVTELMDYMPTAVAVGYLREPDVELTVPGPNFARRIRILLTAVANRPDVPSRLPARAKSSTRARNATARELRTEGCNWQIGEASSSPSTTRATWCASTPKPPRTALGDSLEDWAQWLLADPDVRGARAFATSWQDRHGALAHDQRLIPLSFFTLGGTYEDDNLAVKEVAQCMRIRGPLAQALYSLPDGAPFEMSSTPPPSDPELLSHHELEVFADYSTLLVQDDDARLGEPESAWFEALAADWINTAAGLVGIGAGRPFDVPVTVDVRRAPPTDDDVQLQQADHVTQASLALPSGRLLISMQDFSDELPRIRLTPGTYAVRVYSHGLHTISGDGLDGEDR
ncbi:hypothetical protein [Streptomyces nigrescens]